MKKVLLILLISLFACGEIEENFDDHIILEKSKEKTKASSLKPQTRLTIWVTSKYSTRYTPRVTTRYTSGVTTKYSTKVKTLKIPRKTVHHLKDFPIKGTNGLFKKSKEKFEKKDSRQGRGNIGIPKKHRDPRKDLSEEEYIQLKEFVSRNK